MSSEVFETIFCSERNKVLVRGEVLSKPTNNDGDDHER
jgi:hypothetical protein